jgi:hypothetical protein
MVVVIKEPYFKFLDVGKYLVRVDHVSDVLWLTDGDERIPDVWQTKTVKKSAIEWKVEGDEATKQGNYWNAIAR